MAEEFQPSKMQAEHDRMLTIGLHTMHEAKWILAYSYQPNRPPAVVFTDLGKQRLSQLESTLAQISDQETRICVRYTFNVLRELREAMERACLVKPEPAPRAA